MNKVLNKMTVVFDNKLWIRGHESDPIEEIKFTNIYSFDSNCHNLVIRCYGVSHSFSLESIKVCVYVKQELQHAYHEWKANLESIEIDSKIKSELQKHVNECVSKMEKDKYLIALLHRKHTQKEN